MGSFSSQFNNNRDSEKPECYGDTDYYDISHPTCQDCAYKGTCRLKVEAGRRSSQTSSTAYRPAHKPANTPPPSRNKVYDEPEENDTFTGVLAYNTGLNAVTTMAETLTEALAGIPRKKYPGLRRRERR
jgi:hypothetical protein